MSASAEIDAYIAAAAPAARPVLERIREIVREVAPDAREAISYRMPAFFGQGVLVYFAAFKTHIGLFPPVKGDAALVERLAPYRGPKGNLAFLLDRPMPYELIAQVVRQRVREDMAKAATPKRARAQGNA